MSRLKKAAGNAASLAGLFGASYLLGRFEGVAFRIPGLSTAPATVEHLHTGAVLAGAGDPDRPLASRAAAAPSRAGGPADAHGRTAASPTRIPLRGWKDILVRTYEESNEDRILSVAAGVVFYGLLALFPAITAFVSLYGLFADPATVREHIAMFAWILPRESLGIITDQLDRLVSKPPGTLGVGFAVGLGLALWSANAGIKALFDGLNIVYEEREKRSFVLLNAVSLAFTLGAIVFMLVAIGAVIVLPTILDYFYLTRWTENIISLMRWPAFFVVVVFGLMLIYRFGPSRKRARWRWVSVGAIVAAVLWVGVSAGFSYYLANFGKYGETYGSLGAAIGLMMWLWLTAVVVLLGGELDAEIEHQTAVDSTTGAPKPMGMRGATMADEVGGTR